MRSKITVIGAPDVVDTLVEGDIADVVAEEGLAGSDVVVIGPGADVVAAARSAASRASGAAVIILGGDVRAALEASFLPRARVFGVTAGNLRGAVEAVLLDRSATVEVEMVGLDDRVV